MKAVPILHGWSTFQDNCNLLRSTLFTAPPTNTKPANLCPPREDLWLQLKKITSEEISKAIKSVNQQYVPLHNKIINKVLTIIKKNTNLATNKTLQFLHNTQPLTRGLLSLDVCGNHQSLNTSIITPFMATNAVTINPQKISGTSGCLPR